MATSSSYVFNGQAISIDFSINSGSYKTIAGTDGSANWVPTSSTVSFTPLTPTHGALQWGKNTIQFMPTLGTWTAQSIPFEISSSVNPQAQLQIYLFWESSTQFTLVVLVNGQVIFSGDQAQAVAVHA